jgi:transglutaminase-like putative cysteine protease
MAQLAREGIRQGTVLDLSNRVCSDSDPVLAIDDFLRSRFVYRGESDEVLRTVEWMVQDLEEFGHMEGDCDDMSTMCGAMLGSLHIPARFTAIASEPSGEFDHVFCEARIGTNWLPIDPTVEYGTQYFHYGIMSEGI